TQPQAPQVQLTAQAPVEVPTTPQAPQVQLTAQAPVEAMTQPQAPQVQLTAQAPVEVPTQPQAPQVVLTAQAPVEVPTQPQAPQVVLTAQAPVEVTTTPQAQQVVVQSQPQIAVVQSTADDRPAQNVSTLLNANAQVEETPTTQPVTAPQAPPQQFEQSPQRDAQNFQGQAAFQAPTNDAPQAQPVATGGEVFAVPVTPTNDAPPPQPIQPAQAPDAPPAPPEDFDVPAQIVRQARLIRSAENTQMVIKLNPEHLGELTLRVSVSTNGAVNASFHSDNAQVRTIIENSLVQLRQELNNVGLKVENVQVFAGLSDGNLMSGQGGQAWQQSRQQRQTHRINFDALERDIDAAAPVAENIATEGVDYSV
ncbi:MAG: flagellar hook-length control protein FliK, partial [Quinella sp. 1Q7]|nr:flagellar hook-length control protein FliK [Quinella sp. 1Q7]